MPAVSSKLAVLKALAPQGLERLIEPTVAAIVVFGTNGPVRSDPLAWSDGIAGTSIMLSVTGRIGVVAASRGRRGRVAIGIGVGRRIGRRANRSHANGSTGVHRSTKRRAPSDTSKGHRRHRSADNVDEEGSTAIAAGQVAFEDLNIERQFVTVELWRF